MTRERNHIARGEMQDAVGLRQSRQERWQREGERSVLRNLAMFGALGWLIVIPALLGVVLGRWLDDRFNSGVMFSAAMILLGAALGFWLAWRRSQHESDQEGR